jgi:hypothetical protein
LSPPCSVLWIVPLSKSWVLILWSLNKTFGFWSPFFFKLD